MDNLTFTFMTIGIILVVGWLIMYIQERKKKHTH